MKSIFVVLKEYDGKRVDIYLSEVLEDVTRSQIKKSISEGKTFINGSPAKASRIVRTDDEIEFEKSENETEVVPEDIPLQIVYEDDEIAVINKPQGMTVHPAPGNYTGTLVNALLAHYNKISSIGGNIRPGIVHRIDKDTSGLLVIAKTNSAHLSLAKQIAQKTCKRTYFAIVEGTVKSDEGTINQPVGRSKKDRKQMAVIPDGKPAVTHYKVLSRYQDYTFMQFDLETGRTHQIRVHSKFMGHPIVGDKTYGYKNQKIKLNGQLLHAGKLVLTHPKTKEIMTFNAPLPDYFERVLKMKKLDQ